MGVASRRSIHTLYCTDDQKPLRTPAGVGRSLAGVRTSYLPNTSQDFITKPISFVYGRVATQMFSYRGDDCSVLNTLPAVTSVTIKLHFLSSTERQ